MKIRDIPALEAIVVVSLLAIAFTVVLLLFPGLKNEASAAWAQAIFGAAAIASTVWFATAEARRRRRDAEILARLAVAGIEIKVSRVSNTVDYILDAVKDEFVRGYGQLYGEFIIGIEDAGTWETDEILPLAILPRDVAKNLATTRARLQNVVLMMKRMQRRAADSGNNDFAAFDRELIVQLSSIRAELAVAQEECRVFSMRGQHK